MGLGCRATLFIFSSGRLEKVCTDLPGFNLTANCRKAGTWFEPIKIIFSF
jgi:hypothetical protein